MYTWIRLLVFNYSFISSIFFLSNSKTLNFWSHFSVRPTKLQLDTHMGKGLIYCVHQKQAARIYLFLYFSSFFCLSNWQRLKTCIYKIVSNYLWWLRPGVCELCSLSAVFYSFISSIFFLSNSKTLNFWSHFSLRPTKLKLETHMVKGLIYCVHQI